MTEMARDPDASVARRLVGGLGVVLVCVSLGTNEWWLAWFSADGVLEPLTVARIRLLQGMLAFAGALLLGARRWASRPASFRALLRERPRLSAVILGSCLALVMLLAAEAVHGVLIWRAGTAAYDIEVTTHDGRTTTDSIAVADDLLGYKLTANRKARIRVTLGDRTIYEMMSATDEFGRRITPVETKHSRTHHLLFFGGSYTWGQGVGADETLPAAVGRLALEHQPYNYGYRGYGPQQMLELLRAGDIRRQVPEREGIAVYTAIDDHVRRAIGGMRTATGSRRVFPYFQLDEAGRLVRHGSFEQGRPWLQLLYDGLATSQVLQYYNVDFPLRLTDDHFALMVAMIAESRRLYQQTFGSDRFYVVLYPQSLALARLRPHLDRLGVRYFDYSDLFTSETRPLVIADDGHPTPLAYSLVAMRLVEDLGIARQEAGVHRR